MRIDRHLVAAFCARTAHDHGVRMMLDAWSGIDPAERASGLAALGDIARAGACGGAGWRELAAHDVRGALRIARAQRLRTSAVILLEAEALVAAGAVVAGLKRLEALHRRGDAAGTLALARRTHLLGDHARAERVAMTLPMHAQAALIGARAAGSLERPDAMLGFLAPFLEGAAPVPEPGVAAAIAGVAAAALARRRDHTRLRAFADRLLATPDLVEDMMPMVARTAWTAGLAAEAWKRFSRVEAHPWMAAARLELALLAGDARRASRELRHAGAIAAPGAGALLVLEGRTIEAPIPLAETFSDAVRVHLWRTHPTRWRPWVDALERTAADIEIVDLARGPLPAESAVPQAVLDDGSLIESFAPVPVPPRPIGGAGVWISKAPLCAGVGIGHDWPETHTERIKETFEPAPDRTRAAVRVLGARAALECAGEGRPTVVVAPPGDPFWAGPLPERAWPAMRIVRADPKTGWRDGAHQASELIRGLLAPCAG